jgi:hypothetical protein
MKRYERRCANSIGRILKQQLKKNPALIGKAGHSCASIGKAWFAAPITKIRGFFYVRCTSPRSGIKIAAPIVLAQRKGHKRRGEAQK